MAAYHNNEQDKHYNCGNCHTTGWRHQDAALNDARQDDLPFMDGTFFGGRIAAKGGLIRHHEQYDEVLGIDPDTLLTTRSPGFMATHGDCNTCHNPHGSSVNADNSFYTGMPGVDASNDGCLGCHGDYDPSLRAGGMLDLDCVDCHMPKLAKSATSVAGEAERPAVGDVSSHIFRISLDSTEPQFTDSGSYAYPAVDEAWACATCHHTAPGAEAGFAVTGAPFIDTYLYHNNLP